jgi:hypothetical protein
MPEIEIESLIWLVWGSSLLGLQSSVTIWLNEKRKVFWPVCGSLYFLLIFFQSLFFFRQPLLLYRNLTIIIVIGIGISIIFFLQMIRKQKWCGICLRIHFVNILLLLTVIEAWPKIKSFFII